MATGMTYHELERAREWALRELYRAQAELRALRRPWWRRLLTWRARP